MNYPIPSAFQQDRFGRWFKFGLLILLLFLSLSLLLLLHCYVPLLFTSLMVSLGFFYALNPIVNFLEARSIRRSAASAMVLIGLTIIMYIVWARLLTFDADLKTKVDLDAFQKNLTDRIHQVVAWAQEKAPTLKKIVNIDSKTSPAIADEESKTPKTLKSPKGAAAAVSKPKDPIFEQINEQLKKLALYFFEKLIVFAPNLIFTIILVPYFTFFLLKDGRTFKKVLIKWIPNRYFEPALKFFYEMNRRMRSYLQSMFIDCSLVGLLVGIGSVMVDAPYPVIFGLMAFVLNSIPLLGPLTCAIICLVITVGTGKTMGVVFGLLGVFILARLCDDLFFAPLIYGKSHQLHPVLVICAILVGESVVGIWGMLLAVPMISILLLGLDIIRDISTGEETLRMPSSVSAPFA